MRSCSRSLAGVCATVRFGLGVGTGVAVVSSFPRFPQAEIVSAAHSSTGAARRRQPVFLSRGSARCVKSASGPTIRLESSISSLFCVRSKRKPVPSLRIKRYIPPSTSTCPTRSSSIRGPPREETMPRTRIRLFSSDLGPRLAFSNAGTMRLGIVAAKSRVQF